MTHAQLCAIKVPSAAWLALGALAFLGACSPALDWRDVRPAQGPVQALFPCKPKVESRKVMLAAQSVAVQMHACEADGAMYALAVAEAPDAAQADAVAQALRLAQAANLGAALVAAPSAAAASRSTAQRWALSGGHLPDGRSVAQHMAVWTQGRWVVQALVMGPRINREAFEIFVEGVVPRP